MKFPPTVTVDCPVCGNPITVPAFLKPTGIVTINFEESEAKRHIQTHVEELTTAPRLLAEGESPGHPAFRRDGLTGS
jgi:hypothetical protein